MKKILRQIIDLLHKNLIKIPTFNDCFFLNYYKKKKIYFVEKRVSRRFPVYPLFLVSFSYLFSKEQKSLKIDFVNASKFNFPSEIILNVNDQYKRSTFYPDDRYKKVINMKNQSF